MAQEFASVRHSLARHMSSAAICVTTEEDVLGLYQCLSCKCIYTPQESSPTSKHKISDCIPLLEPKNVFESESSAKHLRKVKKKGAGFFSVNSEVENERHQSTERPLTAFQLPGVSNSMIFSRSPLGKFPS